MEAVVPDPIKLPDPSDDLYLIFDTVGLRAPDILNKREPMPKIIQKLRGELAQQLRDYIAIREEALIQEARNGKI